MPDSVVYADKSSLFTLKGNISVEFMDGEVLVGEFATQDAYNIFVKVTNDLLMIPRQQIRFIRGTAGQSIERDTSQDRFDIPVVVPSKPLPEPAPEVITDDQPVTPLPFPDQSDTGQEESQEVNGTLPLELDSGLLAEADKDKEEDGTAILEAGTDLRSPGSGKELANSGLTEGEDDADEELETTVVLDDSGTDDEGDEVTIALGMDEETPDTAILTVIRGPHTGDIFTLHTGITTMGRSSDNDIVLAKDKEISRHHAILLFEAGNFIIQDQNSLNGTFVNDEPVSDPYSLKNGDTILVGVSHLNFEQ